MGNKVHAMSSSILSASKLFNNVSNCSQASIKLRLSCTIYAHHNINCNLISMQSTKWTKKLQKLDDIKKFSILKNGIGIECQKSTKTSYR